MIPVKALSDGPQISDRKESLPVPHPQHFSFPKPEVLPPFLHSHPPSCPCLLVNIPAGIFFIDPQMTDNLPNFSGTRGKGLQFFVVFFLKLLLLFSFLCLLNGQPELKCNKIKEQKTSLLPRALPQCLARSPPGGRTRYPMNPTITPEYIITYLPSPHSTYPKTS